MAIFLPKTILNPKMVAPCSDTFPASVHFPVTLRSRNSRFTTFSMKNSERNGAASLENTDSLASILNDLQEKGLEEKEERDAEEITNHRGKSTETPLADRWLEIHGQNNWENMLDPIDPLLRMELLRYGEMAQACYDAFDFDKFSKYCGSCKYNRRFFFDNLGMKDRGYNVTRYIYATSNINIPNFSKKSLHPKTWSESANWIGYIAVSDDERTKYLGRRDILVAWRGTITRLEWIADLKDFLRSVSQDGIPCNDPTVKVESGFLDLYTDKDSNCRFCKYSAREQILSEMKRLVERYSKEDEEVSISITGHSLGSALAMLSAYDIVETGVNGESPVCVFSFSGPRVGNRRFKERMEGLGVKVLRVLNVHDTVPKVPGIFLNEKIPAIINEVMQWLPWSYSHVGVELALDHKKSPFLKETSDLSCFHNLEAHLHLLDGYHGKNEKFVLTTGRDPALVNKSSNFLREHHLVPPYWRQDENKGMIRSKDGKWMQPERTAIDDHPNDMHHHLRQLGFNPDE